jgi:flagellar motility protein MotE (MotC chaperone)
MSFKIRPLTAIAFALGALGVAQVGRVAFDASSAFAAGELPKPATKVAAGSVPPATTPTNGPPMCLPVDLAKEAGISAAEFRLLQSLQERRQTLDSRERDIVTRENVLKTADGRITERMAALKLVEGNIQKLLGQVDDLEAARIASLVAVYEKMKPKDAARIMEGLEEEVLLKIAQRMKTQPMALILANMSGERARRVTQRLAAIDSPDMSAMTNAPVVAQPPTSAVPPATANAPSARGAAAATAPAPAPTPTPKAGQAAATTPLSQQAATTQPPATNAGSQGAGPNPPRVPDIRTPNAPTTPQPAARAASGQAPADPAARARAGGNGAGAAKG